MSGRRIYNWENKREACAEVRAFDACGPAVSFGCLAHDCKAKPRAWFTAGSIGSIKAIEYTWQVGRSYSRAVVLHNDFA